MLLHPATIRTANVVAGPTSLWKFEFRDETTQPRQIRSETAIMRGSLVRWFEPVQRFMACAYLQIHRMIVTKTRCMLHLF